MGEIQNQNTIYDYTKPFQQLEEQRVNNMLLANATADAVNRRPPIPYIGQVTPRFGYRTEALGIADVLNVDDVFPSQFGDWSGSVSGFMGTAYPQVSSM